jgi:ABC-2 type transport system permease protein
MNAIALYRRYFSIALQAKMQYPLSFLMITSAAFISACAELIAILALFARFDHLLGWSLAQVALLYGISKTAFSISDGVCRGFDNMAALVKSGNFDLFLMRPRNTALQVMGQDLHIPRLGSTIQSILVLLWAAVQLHVGISDSLLILLAIVGGICLFFGLVIIQGTLCFWSTESLEFMNIFTFGGSDLGQYPISIYSTWFKRFFTFVVPIACFTYFPLLTILRKEDLLLGTPWWIGWITPMAGCLFLVAALCFWNIGVRHYRSTGS